MSLQEDCTCHGLQVNGGRVDVSGSPHMRPGTQVPPAQDLTRYVSKLNISDQIEESASTSGPGGPFRRCGRW